MQPHQLSAELDRWENEGGALSLKRREEDAETDSHQPGTAGQKAGNNPAPHLAGHENPQAALRAFTKGSFHAI